MLPVNLTARSVHLRQVAQIVTIRRTAQGASDLVAARKKRGL